MPTEVPLNSATAVGNTGPSHSLAGPRVRKGYRDEGNGGNVGTVHSSFHTVEKDLEYKDFLVSTFTQADHERG